MEDKIALVESTADTFPEKNDINNIKVLLIESRFGNIYINPEKAITFPHGIPGRESFISFGLTDIPGSTNSQFKFLQCLNDYGLSFIVLPATYDNQIIEENDITSACDILSINKNDLLLLFIATVHETETGIRIAINARAPFFIDTLRKIASQYILPTDAYSIQQFIS